MSVLFEDARAKVNLTLRVLGRRADGYHDLASLVAFADCAGRLTLEPGAELSLTTAGPRASECGEVADNLVIKAARLTNDPHHAQSIAAWCGGHYSPDSNPDGSDEMQFVVISTLEGKMLAAPGDWIIQGVNGEFYPCKDDIFRKTYEALSRLSAPTAGATGGDEQ